MGKRLAAYTILARGHRPLRPTREDARRLLWLQAELGERFVAGVLLHTRPRVFRLADGIVAAPISMLWS